MLPHVFTRYCVGQPRPVPSLIREEVRSTLLVMAYCNPALLTIWIYVKVDYIVFIYKFSQSYSKVR